MNTLFSFILVLGLLIFVHELGHFLFAKLFRVKVLKFSLGFGPALVSKVLGETEYVISALPLGGYVKMFGENPDEQEDSASDRARSFAFKPVWQRFFIVLAGPVFNLLFALFLFVGIYALVGLPEAIDTTRIGQVVEGSAAADAGLAAGDLILEIDGVETVQWMDVLNGVKESKGRSTGILFERDGEQQLVIVTPQLDDVKNVFGEKVEARYMIGIVKDSQMAYTRIGLWQAIQSGAAQTWMFISLTMMGFLKIIQQVVPASELGGPILIAQIAGQQMQAGWINLLYFMGLLSVNLGILNLLPIPVLDGGHLVFLSIEGLRRRPIGERTQIFAQQVGIALLGSLMIFVFYNDIARLFSK